MTSGAGGRVLCLHGRRKRKEGNKSCHQETVIHVEIPDLMIRFSGKPAFERLVIVRKHVLPAALTRQIRKWVGRALEADRVR